MITQIYYDWSPESLLEIVFDNPDNFLKIRETLTRIGIAHPKENIIYQSCFILHKQGKYFLVHFKELFILDGKPSDLTIEDIERRNKIASLLRDWKLCTIVKPEMIEKQAPMTNIKIVPFKEKHDWQFVAKYKIGGMRKEYEDNKFNK